MNTLALVVDDDAHVRAMLVQLLSSSGFECLEADSAEAALSLLADNRPRLCVLDIAMPGMSGAELAWNIKQLQPALPLVAVSGHLDAWDHDDLADLGFTRVFGKPFDVDEFLRACEGLLGEENPARP